MRHVEDWINELFLSCRFQARAQGRLQRVRLQLLQVPAQWSGCSTPRATTPRQATEQHVLRGDGYRVQRRCPHLKADLTRFGDIEDGVLTCTLHGWQFELATGRCLTSDDRHLYAVPLATENGATPGLEATGAQVSAAAATQGEAVSYPPKLSPIQLRCKHCWYQPNKFPERSAASSAEKPEKAD